MRKGRRDDYTIFLEDFKPHIAEDEESLRLYHWEGEDWERLKKADPNCIWTILDCDGKMYICPGYHYVNRMDYLITEKPWREGQRDYRY